MTYSTALLEGFTVFNDVTSIGILCSMVFTQFEYCVLQCSVDYYTLLYPVIRCFMVNCSCSMVFWKIGQAKKRKQFHWKQTNLQHADQKEKEKNQWSMMKENSQQRPRSQSIKTLHLRNFLCLLVHQENHDNPRLCHLHL